MIHNSPILVTGSHRSGSTWTGKMISLSNDVRYIDETFTPSRNHHKSPIQIWYVDADLLTDKKQQQYTLLSGKNRI